MNISYMGVTVPWDPDHIRAVGTKLHAKKHTILTTIPVSATLESVHTEYLMPVVAPFVKELIDFDEIRGAN